MMSAVELWGVQNHIQVGPDINCSTIVPARSHQSVVLLTAGRAMVLMQAYSSGMSKAAAAAAEQASKQAAIAAGLLPTSAAAGGDAVVEDEAARIRRLKAQGRYQPY